MTIKQFIKRIIEENNIKLKAYIDSLLVTTVNTLQQYVQTEISNIPATDTYTKQEIEDLIESAINIYDLSQQSNYSSADNKTLVTSDRKVFFSKEGEQVNG